MLLYPFSVSMAQTFNELEQNKNYFLQCLASDPASSDINYNLGLVYEQMGIIDKAIKYYRQAVYLNKQDAEAWLALGSLLRKVGSLKESINSLEHSLQLQKNNSRIWYELAMTNADLGNFKAAIDNLKLSLKYLPENENEHKGYLLYYIGVLHLTLRNFSKLKTDLITLKKNAPNKYKSLKKLVSFSR